MAHIHLLSIENENIIQNFLYDGLKDRIFREIVDKKRKNVVLRDCVEDNVRVQL